MKKAQTAWIWLQPNWPKLSFDSDAVADALGEAHRMQGLIEGKSAAIGLKATHQVVLDAMADEVLATAAIEGERLSLEAIRSSVMRRLGLGDSGPVDRDVDGLVQVIADAATGYDQPLDQDRLCRWQSALFPGGTSGIHRIAVGRYRDHADPMQIVGGPLGREIVHYEAPPSSEVPAQMRQFLKWFAATTPGARATKEFGHVDGVARAAIAHLWFESIHPFEDGNGRIGRAIVDMALSQHLGEPTRLYSLSKQLLQSRKAYYESLNTAQRGDGDVTAWVQWFAEQCSAACRVASRVIDQAIQKRDFWERHANADLNDRQRKVVQRLLDDGDGGFAGGLNAEKYMKMTAASKSTTTRDLTGMVELGMLWTAGTGKALRYHVNVPGWTHGIERGDAVASAEALATPTTATRPRGK